MQTDPKKPLKKSEVSDKNDKPEVSDNNEDE
jgi:hypothetical protein